MVRNPRSGSIQYDSGNAVMMRIMDAMVATVGLSLPDASGRWHLRGCTRSFSISTKSLIR